MYEKHVLCRSFAIFLYIFHVSRCILPHYMLHRSFLFVIVRRSFCLCTTMKRSFHIYVQILLNEINALAKLTDPMSACTDYTAVS